ncbi:MAG: recombinase family protein [Chloroflexi bacterium]|nr:recombinase family protein [Chloroflexota bacterium]
MAHYPSRSKKPQPNPDWPADKRWVVGYTRVSDNPQAEPDRASLGDQDQGIRKRCRDKGYFLIRVFSDVGRRWDATRPDFQEMIRFIKENLRVSDMIMVWCADRIVGSASTCAALEPLLDQGGIDIEGVVEEVSKRWLLLNAIIAKGETEAKRERGRIGIHTAVSRGHFVGTAPYGRRLNKEKQQVELDPEEVLWYRRMLVDWKDWGDDKVSRYLNRMGVPQRMSGTKIKNGPRKGQILGKGWTRSHVRDLRTNEHAYGKGTFKIRGGEVLEFPLPAVVTKSEFDEAQKLRAKRIHFGSRSINRVYPIRHNKFKCGGCGLGFRMFSKGLFVKRTLASGEVRAYRRRSLSPLLTCRGMYEYPHTYDCRQPKHLDYEIQQGRVLENLLEVLTPEFCQKMVSEPVDNSALELRAGNAIASRDETKRELAWLVTQARKGIIPNDIFEQQAFALKEEMAAKERYAQQAEAELENARNNQTRTEQIAYSATVLRENVRVHSSILNYLHLACPQGSPLIEAYRQKLDEAAETVRDTVDDLIDSIIVMPDRKLIINYNFPLIDDIRSRQLTIAS